jgi:hypothetical protein
MCATGTLVPNKAKQLPQMSNAKRPRFRGMNQFFVSQIPEGSTISVQDEQKCT